MSKRKPRNYEPPPRDFWPTPRKAVEPLIPHLRASGVKRFAEPCCGEMHLVRHLEEFGFTCVYAGDIATGQDAMAWDGGGTRIDACITNPPFSRKSIPLMKRLVLHLQAIAPTWFLLPSDMANNVGMAKYMKQCSDTVPIRRVRWIDDSEFEGGLDNFSWYRFDAGWRGVTRAWGWGAVPGRLCVACGQPYRADRSDSRTCSPACRQRLRRERLKCDAAVT